MPLYKNKSINNCKILWYRQTEKKTGEEFENSSSVCLASGQLQPNDCGHQPVLLFQTWSWKSWAKKILNSTFILLLVVRRISNCQCENYLKVEEIKNH